VQYCVQQLCTVQCTHMNRPNSCLLVRFSFSVVIFVCYNLSVLDLAFWDCRLCYSLCMCAFVMLRFHLFRIMPRDWLGRTSPK